ncbi:hypothetical protein [Streptomyces justiciae]|uniref:Uncharacterized protein n=1 Tax=Streptomyces justiciae TaxID=2780140 RepID=A0ABU3M9F1_9ACTN|nr:hypothetical protein [Streptomyces justiciae]MDT7847609.1 hypothetical protein [Streptomyces justiciae]
MGESDGDGGVRGYRQVDAATLRRWEAWATEARTQLAAAGLPVQAEYMAPAVGGGAVSEAIVEAIRAVLTRGGFTVEDSPNEYALGRLYLVSPPRTPLPDMLEGPASSGEETGPS